MGLLCLAEEFVLISMRFFHNSFFLFFPFFQVFLELFRVSHNHCVLVYPALTPGRKSANSQQWLELKTYCFVQQVVFGSWWLLISHSLAWLAFSNLSKEGVGTSALTWGMVCMHACLPGRAGRQFVWNGFTGERGFVEEAWRQKHMEAETPEGHLTCFLLAVFFHARNFLLDVCDSQGVCASARFLHWPFVLPGQSSPATDVPPFIT